MPETPDFDLIARRFVAVWTDGKFPIGMTASVAEELRQVWNARGEADSKAVHDAGFSFTGQRAEDAIRSLDR